MTNTLYDLKKDAEDELRERWEDMTPEEHEEPHEVIHEIADSSVPVYTSNLMQMAADDISLAVDEPELGPAFDGKPTPVNIVAANVFEAIEQHLWDIARDLQEQVEETEE